MNATPALDDRAAHFLIAQLDQIDPLRCSCGITRRAFATADNSPASIHQVDIQLDARTHYHKGMTEIYIVLEGEGAIELDGKTFPVKPMTSVLIKPGCRHRAIGSL